MRTFRVEHAEASSSLSEETEAHHAVDGDPCTCWSSSGGSPQRLTLGFGRAVKPRLLKLLFQGGFVGQDVEVTAGASGAYVARFQPEDSNDEQAFELPWSGEADAIEITFGSSTDFYGRVIIYSAQVCGPD
jgi:hypothetical protein